MSDEINEMIERFGNLHFFQMKSFSNLSIVSQEFCKSVLAETPEYENVLNVVKHFVKGIELSHCKTCGKLLNFSQKSFCSSKCRNNDKQKIQKQVKSYKETCMERYGYEHPSRCNEIVEKKKRTCLEKYGVECSFQSEVVKEKIKETCKKKYGVEHPSKCEQIKERQISSYKETMKKHHSEITEKIKKTIIERHGGYAFNKSDSRHEQRVSQTWETINSWKDYVQPLFDKNDVDRILSKKIYKWKCTKCGGEFDSHIHRTMHIPEFPTLPRCLKCYPYISCFSNEELELLDFCKSYFSNCEHRNCKLIHPYELDIMIPEIKLAVEFNGCWYHSVENRCKKNYHLNKTILCNDAGYRLIHIWEDEWINNKEEIKHHLEDVFLGREDLNFEDSEIKLDRSWYNNIEIPGYVLKEEICPEVVKRNGNNVENCGFLIFSKK